MELNNTWFVLFIPVLSFILNILFQIIWCRFKAGGGLLKSEYLGCLWGLIALFLMHIYLYGNQNSSAIDIPFIMTNFLIYIALSYCYFHFINLCLTARRIRLVRDLFASGNGLTLNEIQKNYNASEMLKKRTRRLLNSGQISG